MEAMSERSDAQLVTCHRPLQRGQHWPRSTDATAEPSTGWPGAVLSSTAEAEDVAQEVFLRLWNDPDRFDPSRGSLRSFLLAQAHGRAVDAVRSLNARRRREVQEAQRTATSSYDLEHEVWDLALEARVSKALDGLPLEERRAIELAYFKGYTYVEVAQSLGQPEGTVKGRIRNGMQRMRVALVEAGIQGVDA